MISTINIPYPFGNIFLEGFSELTAPVAHYFWPLAPAWQLLFLLITIFIVWRIIKKYQNWQQNSYRREALKRFKKIVATEPKKITTNQMIKSLALLLKTTALQVFPREVVAQLSGQSWLEFLNDQLSKQVFSKQSINFLGQSIYQRSNANITPQELNQLKSEVKCWLLDHGATNNV